MVPEVAGFFLASYCRGYDRERSCKRRRNDLRNPLQREHEHEEN